MGRIRGFRVAISIALFSFLFSSLFVNISHAISTVPTLMNFQGRLTDSAGNIKADGTYNMRFRIYNASTSGTLLWSEDRLVASSQGVTVTNGLFSVQLGSVTSLPASVFTAANTYFEIELPTPATATSSSPSWAEGPMSRSQISTSAYAYNAETLDGLDSSTFAQLGATNAFTAANSISVASANAFQVKNGSTNLFNVDTSASQIAIGTSDTTGVALVLDTKTSAGDPTGTNGAMYYNSNSGKFRCYETAWKNCINSLQDAYDNSTSPATITTSAAAKGISIAAGTVPTSDLFSISNSGQGVTTAGVNALSVNYVGGAAAVEASGMRVDFTPGTTSGGTWSGLRIVANATGPASGVTAYGLKLEGPSSQGAGTEEGMYVGTGWDIGVDVQSGGLQLAAQSEPSTPAAGNLRIYARDIAGRVMPKWVGPAGVDTPIQASLGFNRVSMMMPAGGATGTTFIAGFGSTFTNVATTYANPTPASTNLLTSTRRATFATSATAGQITSHRQSTLQVWRGNAAGLGGFFYTTRFGTSVLQSGNRAFVGLSDSVAAPTNIDPTTTGTGIGRVGMAINASTGNWNFVNNISGTAPTVTALGANFPVSTTALYELVMFSAPNGSSIGYRVTNLSTGSQTSGSVSTNIPSNTTFLAPQFWMTNNTTAGIVTMDFGGWYLESDN